MEYKLQIQKPRVPNFIFLETPPKPRQDGFDPGSIKIDIKELSEEQAKEVANLMYDTFMENWKRKKESEEH